MNTTERIRHLRELGLTGDEAKVYIELLRAPSSHLQLSHSTGVNRTKVYRIIDSLEKRSLVSRRTDDRGTFLVAADPATLEVGLVSAEERIKQQRNVFEELLPDLIAMRENDRSAFVVHTYEGLEGIKQQVWHELKTKGELVIFGSGTTEELVLDRRWAEKHRALNIEAGYRIRELMNEGNDSQPLNFTNHREFFDLYSYRRIPASILLLENQVAVYNDTVSIYHWRENQKVGVEIVNSLFATSMRQMFEHYWGMAA